MKYSIFAPVPCYRLTKQTVAVESAFAGHLRLFYRTIMPLFGQLVVAMVEISAEDYEERKAGYTVLHEIEDGITIEILYREMAQGGSSFKKMAKFYLCHFFSFARKLFKLVKQSDVIHAGTSDISKPPLFLACLFGVLLKKPTLFVVDTDDRNSAWMDLKTGRIKRWRYILRRYIYDKLLSLQIIFLIKAGCLALLKGRQMCEDYGRGKDHVKNILDSAYSKEHIISSEDLEDKMLNVRNGNNALEIVYFGRLVYYKGVAHCLRAVRHAQRKTARNITFHIFGSGDREQFLRKIAEDMDMKSSVIFHGDASYGKRLFERLYPCHLLLATPLREDSPRSALDALAAGIPILAFDTYYYKDLKATGAVVTVPWLSTEAMGDKIAEINDHRELLVDMMTQAVTFARENTQEIWLNKRFQWTKEFMKEKGPRKI